MQQRREHVILTSLIFIRKQTRYLSRSNWNDRMTKQRLHQLRIHKLQINNESTPTIYFLFLLILMLNVFAQNKSCVEIS